MVGRFSRACLALIMVLPLTACGADSPESRGESAISSPAGQVWAWQSLTGADPIEVASSDLYTLEFGDDGRYAIRADCNSGQGGYTLDGDDLALNPGPMTQAACPPGSYGSQFVALLGEVNSFTRSGDQLTLKLSDRSSMKFEPLPTSAAPGGSEAVAGSKWEISAYNNGRGGVTTLVAATRMSIQFDVAGTASGSSGCNTFSGPYTTDGETISIGPLASTLKMCPDEKVMDQETQFLAALEAAASLEIRGHRMQLRNADGALQVDLQR